MLGADDCIVAVRDAKNGLPRVVYRRAGDNYLLVEYGPTGARPRAALPRACADDARWRRKRPRRHPRPDARHPLAAGALRQPVAAARQAARDRCSQRRRRHAGDIDDIEVPTRIVHLPLSWDDPPTQLAIEKYMQSVRAGRALVPEQHRVHPPHQRPRRHRGRQRIVFDASYLVMGLGDVYLGAPVATPRRSAPPPGHHQVQPGAHLDAGERGRHRRRLPVRLRHGRPRRLPVRRPHRCRCGTASTSHATSKTASPGCCASSTRSASSEVSGEDLLSFRDDFLTGKAGMKIEETTFCTRRLPQVPRRQRRSHSRLQDHAAGRLRGRTRPLAGERPRRRHPE